MRVVHGRLTKDSLLDIQNRLAELKQTIAMSSYNELIQKEQDELEKLVKTITDQYAQQDFQMEELKGLGITVFIEVYNQKIIDQQTLLGQSEYQFQQPLLNFTSIVQQLSLIGRQHKPNSRQFFIERINNLAKKAKSIGTWKHSFFHLNKLLPGFVTNALQLQMIGYPFPLIHPKLEAFQKKYLYSAKKLLIEQLQSEASSSDDVALIAEIEAKNRYLDAVHVHKLGELLGFATDVIVMDGGAHFPPSKESVDLKLPVIHIQLQLEKQHFQFLFQRLRNSPVELINVTGDGNCGVYAVLAAIHAHILKHQKIYQKFLQPSPRKLVISENPSTLLGKRKKQDKVIDLTDDKNSLPKIS